jgi:hypothetical protein
MADDHGRLIRAGVKPGHGRIDQPVPVVRAAAAVGLPAALKDFDDGANLLPLSFLGVRL